MAAYRTLDGVDLKDRRAVVRVDLNVPLKDGEVADATRIERIVPTIEALLAGGASVVLLSHLGRPRGEVKPEASLRPTVVELERLLRRPVTFIPTDWRDGAAAEATARLVPGEIAVCENLRFHPGEEKNDPDFARALAALGDLYVNDAFSAAHRAHASTEGIAHLLPAYAGYAMAAELDALDAALGGAAHPVLAIVGGAKVSTKLDLLENLVSKVEVLVIGGAMANTVLLAGGVSVGRSLVEPDMVGTVHRIEGTTPRAHIVGVEDVVVAPELAPGQTATTVAVAEIPDDQMILDFGPGSVAEIKRQIDACATVVWNGPLGAFEIAPFGEATFDVARHVAALTKAGKLVSVAGGGDTVAALNAAGVAGDFTYVSTAGGAFLEWLEGKELPGVAALAASA